MDRRCINCARFSPLSEEVGECRARPPRVFILTVPVQKTEIATAEQKASLNVSFPAAWPRVMPNQWCGEFAPMFAGEPPAR